MIFYKNWHVSKTFHIILNFDKPQLIGRNGTIEKLKLDKMLGPLGQAWQIGIPLAA